MHEVLVDMVVEVGDAESLLDASDSLFGRHNGPLGLIDLVVSLRGQSTHDACELGVEVLSIVGAAGDDERGSGLVDEDRVDLVDDGEVVAAFDLFLATSGHVVTQIVEAELVVRAVGDVGGVGVTFFVPAVDRGNDDPDLHPEERVDLAHPFGISGGEVVVDGDEVHPLAAEGVEIGRHRRDEGLALAGLHLGHPAEVQSRATHDLDVVVTLPKHPFGGLANHGKCFAEQVVEILAPVEPLAERGGARRQLGIGQPLELGLESRDVRNQRLDQLELSPFTGVQDPLHQTHRA